MANETTVKVRVYEIDGEEKFDEAPIVVSTHWNNSRMVDLEVPGFSQKFTVGADSLIEAVRAATL